MRLRWDRLSPHLTVPYVPTLGPVHPDTLGPDLIDSVLAASGTGWFLPHDKDSRWSIIKTEQVLVDDIDQEPHRTIIPTLTRRGGRTTVKVHHYGQRPPDLAAASNRADKLCAEYGAETGRVVWFGTARQDGVDGTSCTRVLLKDFREHRRWPKPAAIAELAAQLPAVRATFNAFADTLAGDGFAFLRDRLAAGHACGPVLVAVEDYHVVGAIGPMEIMPDSRGAARLLPQYFGVHPAQRGRGYGRALWRAAMDWGHEHGAAYQLLQTELDGASDRICLSEGLTTLGFAYSA